MANFRAVHAVEDNWTDKINSCADRLDHAPHFSEQQGDARRALSLPDGFSTPLNNSLHFLQSISRSMHSRTVTHAQALSSLSVCRTPRGLALVCSLDLLAAEVGAC